jgi:hypothetical protein
MVNTGRSRLLASILGAAVVFCLLYAAAGFLLAPHLIERRITALAQERLGQTFSVEKLKVNPFALSIEASGLRLAPATGSPTLAAHRVYLNLDLLGSGFGRGWVLSEAQTDGLQVLLELQKNGRLNFADLMQRWRQGAAPAKRDAAAPRITIRHLLAGDGMLTYREVSAAPAATQLLPIRVELVNVSTLPDREGRYSVSARFVDGGTLTWRGELSLLPAQSNGDLSLEGLKLATLWKFIRDDVRLAQPQGLLSVATHYRFSYGNGKPDLALTDLRMTASGVSVVREGSHEPVISMKTIEARDGSFQLARRALVLPFVSLRDGRLSVVKDADGAWNWTGLARRKGAASGANVPLPRKPAGDHPAASAWHIDVKAVNVDNVALDYADRDRPTPLAVRIAALHGKAAVAVLAGGGTLDVQAHGMDLRLDKLRLPADETPLVALAEVQLQGGYLELSKRALGAGRLVIDGGTVRLERGTGGALPLVEMLKSNGRTPSTQSPWSYAVGAARVQGLDVALADRDFGQPIVYQLRGVAADVNNVASGGDKPMAFKASARIDSGGTFSAKGSAAQDGSRADAQVRLEGVALSPLQPVVARYAAVDLVSGNASVSATLAYRAGRKPSLSARGPLQLANVRVNEAGRNTRVLAWDRLSSNEARLTLGPDRLLIKEIVVEAPQAKIDISEQRELNLAQLLKHETVPGRTRPAPAAAPPAPFSVHIGELRLRNGTMDYADRSLVLPFSTQVTNFTGTAAGLSTDRDRRATLQFGGRIGEFGSAELKGSIDAFAPKTFMDIDAIFQNVDMPALSPYSATFLGRKIASGKLWLDLRYGIENSQLTGNNDITIHDLTLGEPVDTPTALKIPLDLAVALLTDSEGKIRTAVPVRGNLKDPKFDLGAVIREAVTNLVGKIASAPFRALAGLLGDKQGQGKDLNSVDFEPGSAKLMPSEKEKLQEVAKAMSERPNLKLVVQAPYAPGTDRDAMKRAIASREVALALGRTLQPGEKPGPVVFENLATQRALERLVAKKSDSATVRDLVARYTRQTGEEPKRASMLLRRSGDPKFYEAMFAWLAGAESVADTSVENLAVSRAKAVLDGLRSAGVDPARLESGPVEPGKQDEAEHVNAELSLAPVGARRTTALPRRSDVAAQAER